MAKPECVLRLAGSYRQFHDYLSHRHGVECAKIHEKYGILKYQMAFNTTSTRTLAESMKLPYPVSSHDMEIEYYFRDVAALLAVSADADFKRLHVECEPYVDLAATSVTLTWIEVYLEDGRLVNVDKEGKSAQPSFQELADIGVAEGPVAKYY
ncbi:hypothetical protein PG993_007867 [Apiospora rasikravindrae]|uniref:EthD domain-containing protein n=1 Tax=Apiospora rasikravindrae TaxID=990691 RepID=A0ABR1T043_9PEZI